MRPFEYLTPDTIHETITLLASAGNGNGPAKALAGGTDLLTLMKADITTPNHLIDIKRLGELPRGIQEQDGGISIGALTTLTEIETSPLLQQRYPVLAQAAALAATPQLRNMATIGGNLLQRPRCWYFRNQLFHCWLKGGDECQAVDGQNQQHALFGDGPCYAVHPSDLAPALLALDAQVHLNGVHGERVLPLHEFYALPTADRRKETTIAEDDLITRIHLPASTAETQSRYLKAMDRKVWAFALVSAAVVLRIANRRVQDARLVLGGVAPIPWRLHAAEQELIGHELSADRSTRAADAALAGAKPLRHNGYKVDLAKALLRRALLELG